MSHLLRKVIEKGKEGFKSVKDNSLAFKDSMTRNED